jgi:formylmethanofuran dehydrogenase subunit C
MPLTLAPRISTSIPIEVEGITPAAVRGLAMAQIEQLPILHGNRPQSLAEVFRVTGDPSGDCIRFEGDCRSVHWIGAKLAAGRIEIHGAAGRHVGSEMSGGEIEVLGSTGDWAGAQMRGGTLRIRGSTGDLLGAAYRGSPQGMTGGVIMVQGNTGSETGALLRRGLIAVAGDSGDLTGFGMLAGTILVLGQSGLRSGAHMRRGTIALLGPHPPPMLPGFQYGCQFHPHVLKLLFRELKELDFPLAEPREGSKFDLYNGDALALGRGEIFVPAQ